MWKNRKMEWMLLSVTKMLKMRNLVKRVSYALLLFMFASLDLCAEEAINFKLDWLPSSYLTSFLYYDYARRDYYYYCNCVTGYPKDALLLLKGFAPHALENSGAISISFYRKSSKERWWSIDDYAFNNSKIKSIEWTDDKLGKGNKLPIYCDTIGNSAFRNCTELRNFDLRGCREIGYDAFRNCGIDSLIELNVHSLGSDAFRGCPNLKKVDLGEGGLSSILVNTFKDCRSLTTVKFPSTVELIADSAFSGCRNLSSVSWNKRNKIRMAAFSNCGLTSLCLPAVWYIGYHAFYDSNIKSMTVDPRNICANLTDYYGNRYYGHPFAGVAPKFVMTRASLVMSEDGTGQGSLNDDRTSREFDLYVDSIQTLILGTKYLSIPINRDCQTNMPQLSYLDWDGEYTPVGMTKDLALHLSGDNQSSFFSNRSVSKMYFLKWCNIPQCVHTIENPGMNIISKTYFVETDSLNLDCTFYKGDRFICVNPSGTTIVGNMENLKGKLFGNFKGVEQTGEVEDIDLLRYRMLCAPAIVRDSVFAHFREYYESNKREKFDSVFHSMFPFNKFFDMSYSELASYYNSLSVAFEDMFGVSLDCVFSERELLSLKQKLLSLRESCNKLTQDGTYSYLDAEKKKAFNEVLDSTPTKLDGLTFNELNDAYSSLTVAYDSIVLVANRYKETLQNSKNTLQPLFDESSKVSSTYSNVFPYIDAEKKNAFTTSLSEAGKALDDYDNEKVVTAQSNLQAAYDTIVVAINRYNSTLEESKNQLQTLVDNSSKLGKTTYADIYPYIDNTAKGALSSALTSAQSETVKQTYDVEKIQSAQVKLQSAYDQVIALLNTYNNNLTSAKQTLQQQIDTEGTLKGMGEFAFIDANLQKAYEDALASATTAVSGYDVAAINGAADPLHQAYVNAKNAINSIANELAPAKSILQSQIDKGNAYLENKPYYFTAIYISKLQSRIAEAKNVLSNADISSLRQEITVLNNLFAEVESVITYYKAKEAEMNARFERIYALMDTLKTIGLYDEEGNIIHPAGDIKGMTLFQFDGTNYSYNRCLEVVRQAQSLAAYAGPSDSGFDESGINEYKSKCNDFIDRFNAEFGVLQAKYQAERGKLREMVQKLQKIKDDNPAAYATVDNALREKVETQISEWSNAEGYAEVGNAYANADFSLSDELQEAIASYYSVVNEMSILIANVSDDCRGIANGASMNAVNSRSDYRKGDGILTSESQITISGNNSKSALLDANVHTEVELMSNANTIDLDLNKTYTNVVLAFGRDGKSSLQHHFKVYASNAPQDVETWKLQGEFDNTYDRKSQQKYVAKQFVGFDNNYRYLRIEFVPTAECPQTYIAELRVYHRANKFESEGDEACTQFFQSLAELKAQQESGNISVEKAQKACESYNRFDAFEENNNYATADFKETPSVTYFNANKSMTLPNEVVGSIITSKNGRIVRDTRYDESHPVPANTAVVLEGMGGCSYYLMPTTDYVASVDGNLLQGMLTDGTTQVQEGEAKYYQFSKGTFAWAEENGAPFSAKAGDVYLAIPTGMEQLDAYDFSSIYGIGDDVPPYTGINELQGWSKRKGIFDLNGRPIKVNDSRELMPGVYIVDGKKIVVK